MQNFNSVPKWATKLNTFTLNYTYFIYIGICEEKVCRNKRLQKHLLNNRSMTNNGNTKVLRYILLKF